MSNSISPEEFMAEMCRIAQRYGDEVKEKVAVGLEKIGYEAVDEVKNLSPVLKKGEYAKKPYGKKYEKYRKGAYRRRWTCQLSKERGKITVTVHNKQWSLTHLLEKGHDNRDGTTRSKAIPHISIAQEHANKKAEKLLEGL